MICSIGTLISEALWVAEPANYVSIGWFITKTDPNSKLRVKENFVFVAGLLTNGST